MDNHKAQLPGRGVSGSIAQGFVDMTRARNEGMDGVGARAIAREPTNFRQWCAEELKPQVVG